MFVKQFPTKPYVFKVLQKIYTFLSEENYGDDSDSFDVWRRGSAVVDIFRGQYYDDFFEGREFEDNKITEVARNIIYCNW